MPYDINKLNDRFAIMKGEKKAGFEKKGPPFAQWKPSLADDGKSKTYNIRLLPYQDQNGQPVQEVNYYDDKTLSSFRLVSPAQFGMEDPVAELVTDLRKKDRNGKNSWNIIKKLLPRPRYFAPLIVREEMEKGPQVWELSPTVCKDLYAVLVSEDYRDEDVTDPKKGRDFQVTVSPSGKIFKAPNGKEYPINDIKLMVRGKTSPLSTKEEQASGWLAATPKLQDIFKEQVKAPAELKGLLEDFMSSGQSGAETPAKADNLGSNHTAETDTISDEVALKAIEDQFADL